MKNAVEQFNALDGKIVTRDRLKKIKALAVNQLQQHVVDKINKILLAHPAGGFFNPGPKEFKIQLTSRLKWVPTGTGLGKADPGELYGLEFLPDPDTHTEGLGKAVTPDDIYQYVTDLIINTIEKDEFLPWQQSWEKSGLSDGKEATNYESKKGYRGINYFLLNFEVKLDENNEPYLTVKNWDNPYFLTFKQVQKFKGKIEKGAKGHRVVYFTRLYGHSEKRENGEKLEFYSYDPKKFRAWAEKHKGELRILKRMGWTLERLVKSYIPILKYYNVFNGADISGITWDDLPINENAGKARSEKLEIAEAIVKNYPKPPKIIFRGDQPMYVPKTDTVYQTPIGNFKNPQSYYSVLFHELVHSTGAKNRLKRVFGTSKKSPQYAKEELIAEMGAVFLCAESGILFETLDSSAAYLKGWNGRLVSNMKKDNRFFFRAASKAQEAADHILDPDRNGRPKYQSNGLKAPHHEGAAKEALNACGRLRPGHRYVKGGKIIKSNPGKKTASSTQKNKGSGTRKKREVSGKNKIAPKRRFEEALKAMKFFVFSQDLRSKGPHVYDRTYFLNYDDVGGVVLRINAEPDRVEFEYKGLGKQFDEFILLDSGDYPSIVYDDILDALERDFKMNVNEAIKLKAKYSDTLFRKKDKNQLGLFGTKKPKNPIPKKRKAKRKPRAQNKSSGLKSPVIIMGAGESPDRPERKLQERVAASVGEIPVVAETVAPKREQEPAAVPTKKPRLASTRKNRSKKVLTGRELMQMHFERLDFTGKWKDFMQNPAKNIKIGIAGEPKNGKTSGSTELAEYLTNFGTVLYNFADQGFNGNTQEIWERAGLVDNERAMPSDIYDLDELEAEIATGKYDFVFIDMINDYMDKFKISPQEFKDRFIKKYPDIGFILVFEVTKAGVFKGDNKWMHVVDAIVNVKDFLMTATGRYGNGHYVIWEDEFKKRDPKKYGELFGEKETVITGTPVVMV